MMSAVGKRKEGRVMDIVTGILLVYRAVREYVSKRCDLSQDLKGARAQRLVGGTCIALWILHPASF